MNQDEPNAGPWRWSRAGILKYNWGPFETFDQLVLSPTLREKLKHRLELVSKGRDQFHDLKLPWRYGIFLFGPSGAGKTAATQAMARYLNWNHLSIPAHEILDAHLLERALADVSRYSHSVIVLEDVDMMVRAMEPKDFFTLLDHCMQRTEGLLWVACSRYPELVPKTQLIRPGRFDESIRLDIPALEMRKELIQSVFSITRYEPEDSILHEWVSLTEGLTYAHFEELRQLIARMKMDQQEESGMIPQIRSYIEDQLIAGDRWGGLSDETERLQERVQQVDPRMLMAALEMTDIFRALIEKVIGDAANQGQQSSEAQDSQ